MGSLFIIITVGALRCSVARHRSQGGGRTNHNGVAPVPRAHAIVKFQVGSPSLLVCCQLPSLIAFWNDSQYYCG
jgi:hypothetical protein